MPRWRDGPYPSRNIIEVRLLNDDDIFELGGIVRTDSQMSDLLISLTGTWLLNRSIDDGSSMTGTATFTPRGRGRFDYHEQGSFRLSDGRAFNAERRYLFEEMGGGFTVLFAEDPPRLFHRILLSQVGRSLVGRAAHLCGDDTYDSRYEFLPDGSFSIAHAVRGPRKAYVIETCYVRALI